MADFATKNGGSIKKIGQRATGPSPGQRTLNHFFAKARTKQEVKNSLISNDDDDIMILKEIKSSVSEETSVNTKRTAARTSTRTTKLKIRWGSNSQEPNEAAFDKTQSSCSDVDRGRENTTPQELPSCTVPCLSLKLLDSLETEYEADDLPDSCPLEMDLNLLECSEKTAAAVAKPQLEHLKLILPQLTTEINTQTSGVSTQCAMEGSDLDSDPTDVESDSDVFRSPDRKNKKRSNKVNVEERKPVQVVDLADEPALGNKEAVTLRLFSESPREHVHRRISTRRCTKDLSPLTPHHTADHTLLATAASANHNGERNANTIQATPDNNDTGYTAKANRNEKAGSIEKTTPRKKRLTRGQRKKQVYKDMANLVESTSNYTCIKKQAEPTNSADTGAETELQAIDDRLLERPFTPDHLMEEIMLNESQFTTPSQNFTHLSSTTSVPYYLNNYRIALAEVLNSPLDVLYINDEDYSWIVRIGSCTEEAQMLYIRLLLRQYNWINVKNIKYSEIQHIPEALQELVTNKLVRDNSTEEKLEPLLNMLSKCKISKIMKDMRLEEGCRKRPELIKYLVEHSTKRNVSNMFKAAVSTEQMLLKRVKKELPLCYKLEEEPRAMVMRIFTLFGLVFEARTDNENTRATLIFMMLEQSMGRIKYPNIPTNRKTKIFLSRQYVLRLQMAVDLEHQMSNVLKSKSTDNSEGLELLNRMKTLYLEWMTDKAMLRHDEKLPYFLRRYTCVSQALSSLGYGADLLQRLKLFKEAADLYILMLKQKTYRLSTRGYWYDRLALIYDYHLKDKQMALQVIKEAMSDDNVRVGHRLALYQRAQRISSSKGFSSPICKEITHPPVSSPRKTVIKATALTRTIPGSDRVNVFVLADADGVAPSSVEMVALNYYKQTFNLTEGCHRESSIFTTLYGLLFWDIIYKPDIPDTYYSSYQYQPLDMSTDSFYINRKAEINDRLQFIRSSTPEDLLPIMEQVWEEHMDEMSVCVSWDVFDNPSKALGLISCMGTGLLADIFERFAVNYRFCRSGMPDLTAWNPDTKQYRIVEVKGPNDKLSTKQQLWLDYITSKGGMAEVCYVKVGARELKTRVSTLPPHT